MMGAGGLGWAEIRRGRLKFGLLTIAVSLLVFLILLLTTLSNALVSSLVGALSGLRADGLVYSVTARDNIAASRLDPTTVEQVATTPGVVAAAGLGTFTTSGTIDGTVVDLQVFGYSPGQPGEPTGLVDGRSPNSAGEVAVDGGDARIGDVVEVEGVATEVVGLLKGAQFNALPTVYLTLTDYESIVKAANPGLPYVPLNAVAFDLAAGAEPTAIVASLTSGDVIAYTLADAVSLIPGIESIGQSFGILVGLTFVIGIVVIGFFFLILTVQKLRVFTLLRAVGASSGSLALQVLMQVTVVVLLAGIVAFGLTWLALRGLSTGIPISLEPITVVGTVVAVWLFALLAGLLSVRRITRIDPAQAVGAR